MAIITNKFIVIRFIKKSKRLTIIDQIRGHLLTAMIFDHLSFVGTAIFMYYNYNGNLWVSAAEGFVVISGFMIGYIYVFNTKLPLTKVIQNLLKRVFFIYILSVIFSLIYSQLFWYYPLPQSGVFVQGVKPAWIELVQKSLLFQHHYGWSDILALYVYFLSVTPLIIVLLRKKQYLFTLLISITIWLLAQYKVLPNITVSYFSVFSWQILFILGIIAGSKIEIIYNLWEWLNRYKFIIGITIIAFVLAIVCSIYYPQYKLGEYQMFDKGTLAIGRLLLVPLWLLSYLIIFKMFFIKLPLFIRASYELLGKNSLLVYAMHSLVLALATVYLQDKGIVENSIMIFLLFLVIVFSTHLYERVIPSINSRLAIISVKIRELSTNTY